VQEARKAYAADPNLSRNIYGLATALADVDTDPSDKEAIELLEDASKRLSDYSYRHRAGQIRIKQLTRRYRTAMKVLEKDPADTKAKVAAEQAAQQLHASELEHYRLGIQNYPTDLKLKYEYALRLLKDGRFDEAIPQFQEARKDPSRRIGAMNQIGICFLAKGWLNDALDVFTAALNEHETKDDAMGKELRYNLARTYEEMGQADKALEIYRKIAQLDFAYKDVSSRIGKLRPI
jgi:tetratricopeptide (TPR) repeat protein